MNEPSVVSGRESSLFTSFFWRLLLGLIGAGELAIGGATCLGWASLIVGGIILLVLGLIGVVVVIAAMTVGDD